MSAAAWRSLVVAAAALSGVAANCEQCQPVADLRKGNLDRASDVVLVRGGCAPVANSDKLNCGATVDGTFLEHTFAVVANPELGHLRVFDLTIESFVDGPNRFFPLSIPVGPDTRFLAVAPGDSSRIFALDGASDELFVVRALEDGAVPFQVIGAPIAVGRGANGLGAVRDGDVFFVFVSEPGGEDGISAGRVRVVTLDAAGNATAADDFIVLPDGARPGDIAVDPDGESVVVADGALDVVHIINELASPPVLDRSVDVGGPTGNVSAGVVDVGDGLAPVVIASRRDRQSVVALRLFRSGFPEDRYEVIGSADVPGFPLASYVPDHRGPTSTVCCRGLSQTVIDAREATAAWAAVATADGRITYLSLASPEGLVRLVDNDTDAPAFGDPTWTAVEGDEDNQPTATLTATNDFGDPPFVPLFDNDEELVLTWEGAPAGLNRVRGTLSGDVFTTTANMESRGARAGDIAVITLEERFDGDACDDDSDEFVGAVVAVAGGTVTVDMEDATVAECAGQAGTTRLSVAPDDAFVVFDADGDFLGVVSFTEPLVLPGFEVTLAESASGPPTQRGSRLIVPVDANLSPLTLSLSDAQVIFGAGDGGLGPVALLPAAIVGGDFRFPARELGETTSGRRMVIATGSEDEIGLGNLIVCDEGEIVPVLCERFR